MIPSVCIRLSSMKNDPRCVRIAPVILAQIDISRAISGNFKNIDAEIKLSPVLQTTFSIDNEPALVLIMVRWETGLKSWVCYQIHKIAGCKWAGNAGNVFPATDFKGNRVRHTQAVMHVGIANPQWRENVSDITGLMWNPQIHVCGNRPNAWNNDGLHWWRINASVGLNGLNAVC